MLDNIEKKEWVMQGAIHDIMTLVNLLNEHKNFYTPERLWDQIEQIACEQCFSEESKSQVPHQTL